MNLDNFLLEKQCCHLDEFGQFLAGKAVCNPTSFVSKKKVCSQKLDKIISFDGPNIIV
jgi:hypothetical protein